MSRWPLRLTRPGWMVTQIAGLLLLVGLFKAINLLTLLGFLMLATVLLNLLLVLGQTGRLSLSRSIASGRMVGVPVRIDACLTSDADRKRLDLLLLDQGPDEPIVMLVHRLIGLDSVEVTTDWQPTRRGRQNLGPVVASSSYPFGLIEQRRELLPAEEVIVWPALGEIQRGKLTRQLQRSRNREPSRHRPRPERTAQQEFYGLRPYRLGDSTRLIHWKTSARRGELMIREYEDIPPESLTILFDSTAKTSWLAREQALAFVATVCWEWCRHRGERLVLAVTSPNGDVLAGVTGPELGADLLDLLAIVEQEKPQVATALLRPLAREVGRGSGVLLVSGGPSALADVLRRELGLNVLALTAGDLQHLDGYTPPANLGDIF